MKSKNVGNTILHYIKPCLLMSISDFWKIYGHIWEKMAKKNSLTEKNFNGWSQELAYEDK